MNWVVKKMHNANDYGSEKGAQLQLWSINLSIQIDLGVLWTALGDEQVCSSNYLFTMYFYSVYIDIHCWQVNAWFLSESYPIQDMKMQFLF